MPIVCVGLSHRTAPVDVRERHAFPPSRMGEALIALRDYPAVREAAMLQTCGRLEIYAEVDEYEGGAAQIKSFLTNFRHGSVEYDIESFLYTLLGRQAIEHLFRVATGLDSMLIGEAEILGQVKDAYVTAHASQSLGKVLHRLFNDALAAGKTARAQTKIGQESGSVATAAVEAAKARLGSLAGKTIVVIGAGKMGRSAVQRLQREGASKVIVTNRTIERAREVAHAAGFTETAELPRLADVLQQADVVVASTGASHFILDPQRIADAMSVRPRRPMFVVDIAVPRDADPAIAEIANVTLIDIDGLRSAVAEKLEVRREAIPQVEEIVGEFGTRFTAWYRAQAAVPVIATLTQRAEDVRINELERLFARCPDLHEREKLLISGMTMTIVSKLLHSAVRKIREKAVSDRAEALSDARVLDELFELNLTEHIANAVPRAGLADGGD